MIEIGPLEAPDADDVTLVLDDAYAVTARTCDPRLPRISLQIMRPEMRLRSNGIARQRSPVNGMLEFQC
jgi:hypothetical protein